MKTKKQGTGLLISILFLSLILITGKKYFVTTEPLEEGNQVTFFFTLPSLNELLGPTGETDLFTPERQSNGLPSLIQPLLKVSLFRESIRWEEIATDYPRKPWHFSPGN